MKANERPSPVRDDMIVAHNEAQRNCGYTNPVRDGMFLAHNEAQRNCGYTETTYFICNICYILI